MRADAMHSANQRITLMKIEVNTTNEPEMGPTGEWEMHKGNRLLAECVLCEKRERESEREGSIWAEEHSSTHTHKQNSMRCMGHNETMAENERRTTHFDAMENAPSKAIQ